MKPPGQDPFANMQRQQEQQRRQQEQMRLQQEQQQRMQKMQQDQFKQMQDQQRRQQMGAAWMAQQQAKQTAQTAGRQWQDPRFTQVEAAVSGLRSNLAAGKITSDQVQAELQKLIVQDDQGSLWTVGFETGEWYRYNGQAWEKALPPMPVQAPAKYQPSKPVAASQRKSHPFAGMLAFLFGLIVTAVAGVVIANWAHINLDMHDPNDFYLAVAIWFIGFLLTLRWTGRVWRG